MQAITKYVKSWVGLSNQPDRRDITESIELFNMMTHRIDYLTESELDYMKMSIKHLINRGNRQMIIFNQKYNSSMYLLGCESSNKLNKISVSNLSQEDENRLVKMINDMYEEIQAHYINQLVELRDSYELNKGK